jgi:predicted ester cyclase
MSVEQNREIVRRWIDDVWTAGRLELIDELFSPDFEDHYTPPGGPPGREGIKYDVARIRAAFPDFVCTADDIICEGDRAALRWSGVDTNTGELSGRPAVGTRVTMSGTHFFCFRDGHIVERWAEFDAIGVMRQLGIA